MKKNIFKRIFLFYYEGFKNMTLGKKLWALILIKLFIMFVILKLFFFRNFLNEKFDTDQEKSDYVIEQLTKPKHTDND
jgi:Na+/H+ antiporter NhaD/arsenite permease-like protein